MTPLAEKIVAALMARLSLELDTLDQEEWDEQRQELVAEMEKVLSAEARAHAHEDHRKEGVSRP